MAWKPEIKTKRAVGIKALEFIQEKLSQYDMTQMFEIVITYEGYTKRSYPGGRGRCRTPYYWKDTGELYDGPDMRKKKYRIGAFVRGRDEDLPSSHPAIQGRGPRKYGYLPWIGTQAREVGEITVGVIGHEMYHFLCYTGQIDCDVDDEIAAWEMGYAWVDEYREWKGA